MDKKYFQKDKMVSNVKDVLLKRKSEWSANVAFSKAYEKLDALHTEAKEYDLQHVSGKSTTAKKDQAIEKMVEATLIGTGNAMAYASSVTDKELKTQFDYSKTSLSKGTEKEICSNCMKIYTEMLKIKDKLVPDFMQAEELDAIKEAIETATNLLDKPQGVRRMSKSNKEKMIAVFAEIMKLLNEQLDKLMLKFKVKSPDFYLEYSNARVIGGRKKKKDEGDNTDNISDNNPTE